MKNLAGFIRSNILLILVTILAFSLRLYQLGLVPPSLTWDEAAHGYNAYSILKTGRDEYGYKFPLYFRSFDDYKPPLYTFLTIPTVSIFGLNEFAVRFPSAAFGTLAIISTYILAFALLHKKKIALLTAFGLSVSPWHIQFSRVAFESNLSVFLVTFSVFAFLKAISLSKIRLGLWMLVSTLSFGLSLFVYHSARIFAPLLVIALFLVFRKKLLANIKFLAPSTILATLTLLLLLPLMTSTAGVMRFHGTNIFSEVEPLQKATNNLAQDASSEREIIGKLLHNRRLAYAAKALRNYSSHFSPKYLFLEADQNRHHAPEVGLLFIWEIPFILLGTGLLIARNFAVSSKAVVIIWFLLAPLAAAFTWGVPHSVRTVLFLPIYQIFTAVAIFYALKVFKYPKILLVLIISSFTMNFFYYLHHYYSHMSQEYSKDWLWGRKEAVIYSDSQKDNFDRVIVSTKLEQPHIFWLFYLKYDPRSYQNEGGTISGGFLENRNKFDKFRFTNIDYQNQKAEAKTLFVGAPGDFPNEAKPIKLIKYLNGEKAIYIVDGSL